MEKALDLIVKDTAIEDDANLGRIVHVKERKTSPDLFRVKIFLSGNDLPLVNTVRYYLHPSFRSREKLVARTPSNPNCELIIWAYGMFDLEVVVEDRSGYRFKINHRLSFGNELRTGDFRKVVER